MLRGKEISDPSKAALRARLKQILDSLDPVHKSAMSARVRERLRELEFVRNADCALCFSPLNDEPDIWPWVEECLAARRKLALLRFDALLGEYVPVEIRGGSGELSAGRFGVREPAAWCPVIPWNQLDLVLVPGLGFDLSGGRLGRGRGYYDRLLARVPGTVCGVAFEEQLCETVPREGHDVRLDCLVTPERLVSFASSDGGGDRLAQGA